MTFPAGFLSGVGPKGNVYMIRVVEVKPRPCLQLSQIADEDLLAHLVGVKQCLDHLPDPVLWLLWIMGQVHGQFHGGKECTSSSVDLREC